MKKVKKIRFRKNEFFLFENSKEKVWIFAVGGARGRETCDFAYRRQKALNMEEDVWIA